MIVDLSAQNCFLKRTAVGMNLNNLTDSTADPEIADPGTPDYAPLPQRTDFG